MKKVINLEKWVNEEELEKIEILKNYYDMTDPVELILNYDSVAIYDGYTKEELGKELAWLYGADSNCERYFNYEAFANDVLSERSWVIIEEDNKYAEFYDHYETYNAIFLGKFKDNEDIEFARNEFVALSKHSWDCNWYWGFGYIGNSGFTHLDDILTISYEDLFEHTWIDRETWNEFRLIMLECYALREKADSYHLKDDEKWQKLNKKLKNKLDKAWNLLEEKYKKIEFKI